MQVDDCCKMLDLAGTAAATHPDRTRVPLRDPGEMVIIAMEPAFEGGPPAASIPGLGLEAMLPAETHKTSACLYGRLSHSHEKPSWCTTVEHSIKSTNFMMEASTLRPHR
jgi:hypothetical protein